MTIAITGTASGIGAATAAALGAAGHKIIGVDLRDADITADLSDSDARGAVIDEVLERSGGVLDGLVLSAGLGFNFPDPMKVIEVNYRASLALLDGLLPALRKGESPAAVVVSSLASTQISWSENPIAHGAEVEAIAQAGDNGGLLAYAASKNAVTVGVRQRAAEWGRRAFASIPSPLAWSTLRCSRPVLLIPTTARSSAISPPLSGVPAPLPK